MFLDQALLQREEVWKSDKEFDGKFLFSALFRDTTPLETYRPWILNVLPWLYEKGYMAVHPPHMFCTKAWFMLGDDPILIDLFLRFGGKDTMGLAQCARLAVLSECPNIAFRLIDAGAKSITYCSHDGRYVEIDGATKFDALVRSRLFTRATCIALLSLPRKVSPCGGHGFRRCVPRDILRLIAGMVWAERFNLEEQKKQ